MAGFVRPFLEFDRRALLKKALGVGLLLPGTAPLSAAFAQEAFKSDPFTLGVASGDPAPDGFVIWTRLAPEPMLPRGGMTASPMEVSWEIGTEPSMGTIVQSGKTIAFVELAHSVHVEVAGLDPARDYFYRFRAGGAESPVGRSRTLPRANDAPAQLRFAVGGCQSWEGGYYGAWRAVADEQFDFVFHYGDYIYENPYAANDRQGRPLTRSLPKNFVTCFTLPEYRTRYALYRSDPDLRAAHASCPFLPSFDDHEVMNNWAGDFDSRNTPSDYFLLRRAAAFQAWYEHMPVRRALLPRGPDMLAYRRFRIGNLASLSVLDTRQYRTRQPCGDGVKACAEAADPARTLLGPAQEQWLAEGFRSIDATWHVLAQQVLFAPLDLRSFGPSPGSDVPIMNMDNWNGAAAARERVMRAWQDAGVRNAVVLSGDMHRGIALELRRDWHDPNSCVGVEFLTTSISSGGDGTAEVEKLDQLHANNPHMKFYNDRRGFSRHTVTAKRWQAEYRTLDHVSTAGAEVRTARTFVTEAGRPGLVMS